MLTIIRTVICIAAAIGFVFFAVPITVNVINVGNISGLALCAWVFLNACRPLHRAIHGACNHFFVTRALYYTVNTLFVAFAIYGIIVSSFMIAGMNQSPPVNSTAVVLGAQVMPGGNPSTMLGGRIMAAEKYLRENPKSKAVLSGGQGKGEPVSEARCMYDNLLKLGVSPDRLILEEKSTDTKENLKFSNEIIEKNNLGNNIAVVTDGFHQQRTKIIAEQLGLEWNFGAYNADTSIIYAPTFFVREWFGIPYQLFVKK